MAVSRKILGHSAGDSLTNLKITGSFVMGLNQEPSDSNCNDLTYWATFHFLCWRKLKLLKQQKQQDCNANITTQQNIFKINPDFLFSKIQSGRRTPPLKLFWGVVVGVVNVTNLWGAVRPLAVSRNKALMGSIDEVVKTFKIWQLLRPWIPDCWSHNYSTYFWPLFCILFIDIPECEIKI